MFLNARMSITCDGLNNTERIHSKHSQLLFQLNSGGHKTGFFIIGVDCFTELPEQFTLRFVRNDPKSLEKSFINPDK